MSVPIRARPTASLGGVVSQHAEEVADLRKVRSILARAAHVRLHDLHLLDERIAAHLDGLAVAGEYGRAHCMEALETPDVGTVFAAAVRAIEDNDGVALERILAVVEAVQDSERGLLSAFAWVSPQFLRGTIRSFLSAEHPFRRRLGLAACAMHRVDAGRDLDAALAQSEPRLRGRALRAVGESGRRDLLPACLKELTDEQVDCRFWAAWAAILLGDRREALRVLLELATVGGGAIKDQALMSYLLVADIRAGHALLQTHASGAAKEMRLLVRGAGIVGDPSYVPWLIKQMDYPEITRLAGESFSVITGLDLSSLQLERSPPEGLDFNPNEQPENEDVVMNPDDGLPWPDAEKVHTWWAANADRFESGVRHFVGAPLTAINCRQVLRVGYQRQRIAAALHLSLLQPGTVLFPIAAPAWRQRRSLEQMN
jgi:uncharacterized protein (TIGR02270 family)